MDPVHVFTGPGTYDVKLVTYFEGHLDSITKEVIIYDLPQFNLGNDTSFCDGDTYTLEAGFVFSGYLWQNGTASVNPLAIQSYS